MDAVSVGLVVAVTDGTAVAVSSTATVTTVIVTGEAATSAVGKAKEVFELGDASVGTEEPSGEADIGVACSSANAVALGADPATILGDLADYVHWVTRLKVVKETALSDTSRTEAEKTRGIEDAGNISMAHLTRAWSMLLKGIRETKDLGDDLKKKLNDAVAAFTKTFA